MNPQLIQNVRYKLQKRVRRLNAVEYKMFIPTLRQFWVFFDGHPILPGIAQALAARVPGCVDIVRKLFANEALVGNTEEESAAIGFGVLRQLSERDVGAWHPLARLFGPCSKLDEALDTIREVFLEPFYEYVDEALDDERAMLAVLLRYKHRCEWFHRAHLWGLTQTESRKTETALALDLYSYLHDQGINFNIEPSSLTGEVDLIAAQGSPDPLLADVKVFDAANRGKAYMRKAFNQIYTYSQQYNEPSGYLIIFKTTEKDLRFSLSSSSRDFPLVMYNHKTIFLMTIDIYPHAKPVSQRDPLKVVEVTEQELIHAVEEAEPSARS